ncbi:MAG TPA: hypothetical protein VFU86_02405 [Terriglobales bacterium]|nr:hypothetical protein [Terriglobales bacterium]
MRRFSFLIVLLVTICSLIFTACGGGTRKANIVASVTVPLDTISLNKGEVFPTLSPTATDKNGNSVLADFTYTSDNTSLVNVSTNGAVCAGTWDTNFIVCTKAQSTGSAHVTISASGISTSVTVYVHPTVDRVVVDPIAAGCVSSTGTLQLTAEAFTNDASACTNGQTPCQVPPGTLGNFVWSADNGAVVTFDNNTNIGLATAAAPGITKVHASVSANTSPGIDFTTCPIVSLSIATTSGGTAPFSLAKGGTQSLVATAVDSKNATLTDAPVSWITSQSFALSIAATSTTLQTATVTANNPGTASFLATCTSPSCNIGLNPVYSNNMVGSLSGTSNDTLYVASRDSLQLVPVDLATNNTVGTAITLGQKPNSLVMSRDGSLGAMGSDSASAMSLNTSSNAVTNLNIAGTMLGYSPDSSLLAFQAPSLNGVELLGASNLTLQAELPYTGTNLRVGFAPDSHSVFLTQGNNKMAFWNRSTQPQTVTLNDVANDVAFMATGHAAYLAGGATGQITARATCDPLSQVDSKPAANPQFVRSIPDGSGILALDPPNILVLSPVSGDNACPSNVSSTENSYTVGVANPTQFFVTPDSTKAFITDGSKTVYIFNLSSHTTTPVTLSGVNATFEADITLDSAFAYIGADDGKVHKIDLTAGTDVGQIDPGLKQTDNTTRALPHFVGLKHKK